MVRPVPPRRAIQVRSTLRSERQNHGWGKLVGATVLGVAGALSLALPGAVTGLIVGGILGHLLDQSTVPPEPRTAPVDAADIEREAAALLAGELAELFAALERSVGEVEVTVRPALSGFLRRHLPLVTGVQGSGGREAPALPWQQDLASACQRVAGRLNAAERRDLVAALYAHAHMLGLAVGPSRLLIRDGAEALGIGPDEEEQLRSLE